MKIRKYKEKDTGILREEVVLEKEEQKEWYCNCISMVMSNTRFVLDNLDNLPEFKVNWEDYHRKGYFKEYNEKRRNKN